MEFPKFKANSTRDVLINLGLIVGISVLFIVLFFYVYLPATTNHGETVTVPNVQGMTPDELEDVLDKRELEYEVTPDSGFSSDYPALAVLKQYPKPGAKVKEGRKIYISVNAQNPPKIKMPKLIGGSMKNAQLILQSYGLKLGDIKYIPDLAQNAVLEQWYQGTQITEGLFVPKGAKIDLVVGDGLGKDTFPVPDVIGMNVEEAKFAIIGSGLKIGSVITENSDSPEGTVVKQAPDGGQNTRVGDIVDLWISGTEEETDMPD